jgi:hypothetical protein
MYMVTRFFQQCDRDIEEVPHPWHCGQFRQDLRVGATVLGQLGRNF